jgi:hypothetical protein
METGGRGKIIKPQKTKFKERDDEVLSFKNKKKIKDKQLLRQIRREKEYVL